MYNLQKRKEYLKNYRKKNRKKINTYQREYFKKYRFKYYHYIKKGRRAWNKGLKLSLEYRKKLSEAHKHNRISGKKHPNWKGGITPINHKIRNSLEYKLWRTAVFERDNYTCVLCKLRGKRINADHIKPFSKFPNLRFNVKNGRTLCISCHKKTDTFGSKIINWGLKSSV